MQAASSVHLNLTRTRNIPPDGSAPKILSTYTGRPLELGAFFNALKASLNLVPAFNFYHDNKRDHRADVRSTNSSSDHSRELTFAAIAGVILKVRCIRT